MEKIIAVINQKGGVGKTTTTVSIASALALKGLNTLVVDLDAQRNATTSLGIKDPQITVYEVLKGEERLKIIPVEDNLYLLPASINLAAFGLEMASEPGKEFLLKEKLDAISSNFDYILLDCSPNLGLVTINALSACDYFVIPLLPHHLSIEGFAQLLEVTDKVKKRINPKLSLGGIVLTQYNNHKILHRDTAEVVSNHFSGKLFKTFIRENISLAEAPSSGKSIFHYAPKSNGATDYLSLAEEIINI